MRVEIRREDHRSLAAYAAIPTDFEISVAIDATRLRTGSADLTYRTISPPRIKDYDRIPGNHPLTWPDRFAIDAWVFLAAYDKGGERLGGAVVITEPAGIVEVGGRMEYAVLWDLRVAPSARRTGVGSALLNGAEEAARVADRLGLEAETQDINVSACKLYAAHQFVLTDIAPDAYPEAPDETKLTWMKSF